MMDEFGYISIEQSIMSVAAIAIIVMILSPILIFFGLLHTVFKAVLNGIVNTVKGAVNALYKII